MNISEEQTSTPSESGVNTEKQANLDVLRCPNLFRPTQAFPTRFQILPGNHKVEEKVN